jgi:hypothetical protein
MNSQVLGLRVASIIFGLMGLAQLSRLVIQPEVLVAGHQMPLWPSVLALVILGGLSIWLWKALQYCDQMTWQICAPDKSVICRRAEDPLTQQCSAQHLE